MNAPDFDTWFWSLEEDDLQEIHEDYNGDFKLAYADIIAIHADFYNDEIKDMALGL